MATKIPIMKHRAFFRTLTFYISTNNKGISLKFMPDTYGHILISQRNHDLERSTFKVTVTIFLFR